MHEQYCMDLKDNQTNAPYNNKKRYLLVVMDAFSKQAWLEAIPNKTAKVVLNAFKRIMARTGGVPSKIQIDEGKEFKNKLMRDYLNSNHIELFWTESKLKCVFIERFIRTLFGKIQRYLTHNNTKKFVDKLSFFERLYNHSYHRSIKMAPCEVNLDNQAEVYANLYPEKTINYSPPKFKVGDHVLVARKKKTFEKGYTANYYDAIFTVVQMRPTIPRVYILTDAEDDPILGEFYEQQLLKVDHS